MDKKSDYQPSSKIYILIREFKRGDELQCQEIVKEGIMSTVLPAFLAGLFRELTFEIMVLMSALMFIFLGYSFSTCFASIPLVIGAMYYIIYAEHSIKAEMLGDLRNIPRAYMASEQSGFWVAVALLPRLAIVNPKTLNCVYVSEKQLQDLMIDLRSYDPKIVGVAGVVRSKNRENHAWLRRLAVKSEFQRKSIASKLLDEVMKFCISKNFSILELVTTECQDNARALYLKKGFELKQIYHRKYFCNFVSVMIYNLYFNLKNHEYKKA